MVAIIARYAQSLHFALRPHCGKSALPGTGLLQTFFRRGWGMQELPHCRTGSISAGFIQDTIEKVVEE